MCSQQPNKKNIASLHVVGDQGLCRITKASVKSNTNRRDQQKSALLSALKDSRSIAARLHYHKQKRKTVE